MVTMIFAFFYISVSYLTSYGTSVLELTRPTVLALGILGGGVFAATTVLSALYSDRIGRRRLVVYPNAVAVPWSPLLFPVLDIGTPWAFDLGLSVTLGIVGIAYGPVGAYLPELFSTRYRYTAAGMAYNLGAVLGGAIPPLLATTLAALYGSFSIGVYLAAMALVSLAATFALTETRDNDLDTVGTRSGV